MKNVLNSKAIEILDYLDTFKDSKGNSPNQTKVGLMVQNYCDLYFKQTKQEWYHKQNPIPLKD